MRRWAGQGKDVETDVETADVAALRALADHRGVELRHEDGFDREVEPGPEILAAVVGTLEGLPLEVGHAPERLRAALAEREARTLEPVSVCWGGGTPVIRTGPGVAPGDLVDVRVEGEGLRPLEVHRQAGAKGISLDAPLSPGYYEVEVVASGGRGGSATLIVSPERSFPGEEGAARDWGAFLPLYALRTARSRAVADLTDLRGLVGWVDDLGGAVVGTLPLMAGYLDEPSDPSPYSPVSRLFWNETYLDPTELPEWEASTEARAVWESEGFQDRVRGARSAGRVDYREASRLQSAVLQPLAESWAAAGGDSDADFMAFLADNPEAGAYADFRATVETRGDTWPGWPRAWRRTGIPSEAYDDGVRLRHLYAQFRFPQQLSRAVGEGGVGAGLYLDLPLGPHPAGYDPWAHPELFAAGAGVGAPPDAFHTEGQDWGLPPMRPEAMRAGGHRHFRAILSRLLPHSRYLRVDHVMGLHRMYWVPAGTTPADGAYVRLPAEELYAILCLESNRHRTVIVGEDLGTVPREVRSEMARRDVRRMYVVPFEVDEEEEGGGLAPVPAGSVASLNTHDLPTFAATWREDAGEDGGEDADAGEHDGPLRRSLRRLAGAGESPGDGPSGGTDSAREAPEEPPPDELRVLGDVLTWLGRGPAGLVLVNLEDLWLEERPQNRPGTSDPGNWRRKAALSLEEMAGDARVRACLDAVRNAREAREVRRR